MIYHPRPYVSRCFIVRALLAVVHELNKILKVVVFKTLFQIMIVLLPFRWEGAEDDILRLCLVQTRLRSRQLVGVMDECFHSFDMILGFNSESLVAFLGP